MSSAVTWASEAKIASRMAWRAEVRRIPREDSRSRTSATRASDEPAPVKRGAFSSLSPLYEKAPSGAAGLPPSRLAVPSVAHDELRGRGAAPLGGAGGGRGGRAPPGKLPDGGRRRAQGPRRRHGARPPCRGPHRPIPEGVFPGGRPPRRGGYGPGGPERLALGGRSPGRDDQLRERAPDVRGVPGVPRRSSRTWGGGPGRR